ncbi:DNA-binding response regulator [Cereibacter sphaeroides]|uniref:DNA-binding response regulator n=1 Tax=Cereibacter sphaeroides TaxID=1063 RepID=A0AAX1UKL9_CERSP|nr:response regulator transcription factor [Cereibacter sphaeroides]RHZ94912.1 DNA-binding response regulator [Cereibacter sphaeroides]
MVPCILALDDEAAILTIVRSTLEQRGFRVVTAKSLAQFRMVDAQEQVDLYLIDTSLPDGNGLSLLRELRKVSDRGIILLAPQRDEAEGVLGLELGADDTLLKPFRERELAARVGAVFRRTGRPVASLPAGRPGIDHEFDGYGLSLQARKLWAPDGREVELTTSEFELLAALLGRRGQVLSRDQIMNAIKGRQWESYDRVVDGIVSRLRRKLPASRSGSPFIRTVHGVGYTFAG